MRTLIEDAGLITIAIGAGMIYHPAGVIVAGLLGVLAANAHTPLRAKPEPDDETEPAP